MSFAAMGYLVPERLLFGIEPSFLKRQVSKGTGITNFQYQYSSIVIDDLFSQFDRHADIGVACLYADYKDQSNQTLVHILGSVLCQFLSTAPPIPEEIVQMLDNIRRQHKQVETGDILAMLKLRLHQLKRASICIDAIDELEPKVLQQLLNALKELLTHNARLFLTGRGHIESEVQKHLQVVEEYKVIISAKEKDIQEFVEQQITEDLNPDAMDELLAKEITNAIITKSQGM